MSRVLVACDSIGALESAQAGAALARGFVDYAEVAMLPLAPGGIALAKAVASLTGAELSGTAKRWALTTGDLVLIGVQQPKRPIWSPQATTADVGEWVAAVLEDNEASTVVLDLTGITAHDGGADLLAVAGEALVGHELIAVVAADELELPATGLTGGLARRAYAAGVDVAEVLAVDTAMKAAAEQLGSGLALAPGGGAAGSCGLAVLALGGTLLSGPQFCHRLAGLGATLAAADLVVTGCSQLSALDRGGAVVSAVAGWAEAALKPCVAFSGSAELGRRELRTFGLEAAYQVPSQPSAEELRAAASRVAASWFPTTGREQFLAPTP